MSKVTDDLTPEEIDSVIEVRSYALRELVKLMQDQKRLESRFLENAQPGRNFLITNENAKRIKDLAETVDALDNILR